MSAFRIFEQQMAQLGWPSKRSDPEWKRGLMCVGAFLRAVCGPYDDNDIKGSARWHAIREAVARYSGTLGKRYLASWLRNPVKHSEAWWANAWADSAFPEIIVGHRVAASLCFTGVGESILPWLRSPWPSWLITMPDNLVTLPMPGSGERHAVKRILVNYSASRDLWVLTMETDEFGATKNIASHELVDPNALNSDGAPDDAALEDYLQRHKSPFWSTESIRTFSADSANESSSALLASRRLLVGICMFLRGTGAVRQRQHGAARRSAGSIPQATVYQICPPVAVDLRSVLREAIAGTLSASAPTSQWLVRGHWRNQACGERLSLRRPTWIEPYWKGDVAAPIRVRSHVIDFPGDDGR